MERKERVNEIETAPAMPRNRKERRALQQKQARILKRRAKRREAAKKAFKFTAVPIGVIALIGIMAIDSDSVLPVIMALGAVMYIFAGLVAFWDDVAKSDEVNEMLRRERCSRR